MTSETRTPVVPVVLSGGSGTRLWPVSREQAPKQFLPLLSGRSLLQETVARSRQATGLDPVVVCNIEHRQIVEEQLAEIDVRALAIISEPTARNTAPAVAAAAFALADTHPDAVLLVLPSDHTVADTEDFAADVAAAAPAAAAGHLVTFGISPTEPHTGFGYIRQGPPLAGIRRVCAAERFVEKPDLARARRYVEEGKWLWNSGMFLLSRKTLLDEMSAHEPMAVRAAAIAVALAEHDGQSLLLDAESFAMAPSISLDYAVMERTSRAAVLPTGLGWNDVGAWSAVWDVRSKDSRGNVLHGEVVADDVVDCYLHSDGPLVAAVGLTEITVVATEDAVLVAPRNRSQDVGELVGKMRAQGRAEANATPVVRRPWGSYRSVDLGAGHQVKRIIVKPGHKLSLQRHQRRAEHWVVVAGSARVVRGEETLVLNVNDALHVPVGCVHRLENPGKTELHLVEVQVGDYLGEDDIERLADDYGRA